MKKSIFILSILAAIGIGSALMFGSNAIPELDADNSLPQASKVIKKKISANQHPYLKVTPGYTQWMVETKSNFDKDFKFSFDEGRTYEYSAEVQISGNKARIKGLFDLWYDDVEKEYVLEGTYDQRSGLITIPVKRFDSENTDMKGYVKAAEMYSLTNNNPYTLVVFSGDMNQDGGLNTQEGLQFSVSDDMDCITSRSGFGLYAFDENGKPMAFYDYYKKCTMRLPQDGSMISTTTSNIDFAGFFICNDMEQKTSLNLINKGKEKANVNISVSSKDISVSPASFTIESGERRPIVISLNPSEPGRFDEDITFLTDEGQKLMVHIGCDVFERPDYTLITTNGKEFIDYQMSPVYPFVIEETDGLTVAKSINKGSNSQSWFSATVNIPDGKTGILRYKGFQVDKQPNGFIGTLDKEQIYNYSYKSSSYKPMSIDGTVIIPQGKHEVAFIHSTVNEWFEYTGIQGYVAIQDINLEVVENQEHNAVIDTQEIVFDKAWHDNLSTIRKKAVRIFNSGTSGLRVLSAESTGNFTAEIPRQSVQTGGYIDVPLQWTVNKVGSDSGEVNIHTNAGDFIVKCSGTAEAIPADFHKVSTKGNLSFDTSNEYPFIYNENRGYLYNSSSKAETDGIVNSWLDIMFEVPQGMIGQLSWDAYNDSEELFGFMGSEYLVSGTSFSIDGKKEICIGGVGVHCSSEDIFKPEELSFKPGRHSLRINYKKTSSDPEYVYGDDRVKLYEIGLDLTSDGDVKGYATPDFCNFKGQEIPMGKKGYQLVELVNLNTAPIEILSWNHDGPFSLVEMRSEKENKALCMIEYTPTTDGEEKGSVTIHSNIGDFHIDCEGHGNTNTHGGALYYDSFEYSPDAWSFNDLDNDGRGWETIGGIINGYESNSASIEYGYEAMGSLMYDYSASAVLGHAIDNLMISPEIEIPSSGVTTLCFMACARTWNSDSLEVLVSEGGTSIDDFKSVWSHIFEPAEIGQRVEWTEYDIDLSKFAGKKIRIAFRATTPTATNSRFMSVDDILIANSLRPQSGIEQLMEDRSATAVEWYSTCGYRLNGPADGISIKVTRWSDGSVSSEKIVNRQ